MPKRSALSVLSSHPAAVLAGQTASASSLAADHSSLNSNDQVKSPMRSSTTDSSSFENSDTTLSGATMPMLPYRTLPVKWTPHLGQRRAVKFLLEHAAGALFADPGVGKSSSVLSAFVKLKEQGVANKMLVI